MTKFILSFALFVIANLAQGADERRPTKGEHPRVSLILHNVSADIQGSESIRFTCGIVLLNGTGDKLHVKTNFASVYDGLEIVVTDVEGRVLAQQPYIYHQSPYAANPDRSFALATGKSKAELVFPIGEFGTHDEPVKVRLVGTLPGSTFRRILSTETIQVSLK